MTKEQIIQNYKKARYIKDNYVLNKDEMYLIEELVKVNNELTSKTKSNFEGYCEKENFTDERCLTICEKQKCGW